jgi:Tetratricopeptide repeat
VEDRRDLWNTLARRALLACPLVLAACALFASSAGSPEPAGRRILGLVCVVMAGILVAPGLAGVVAEPAGALFNPHRVAPPEPRRSMAEAKRARGDYADAIVAYEAVVDEFPADVESWTAMVEIAFVHLRDRERGDALARRALLTLTDESGRLDLVRVHRRGRKGLDAERLTL